MASLSERHNKILEQLKLDGSVSVNDLSRDLNVSLVTIRKDLAQLEERKLLYRLHGGAIQIDPYISTRHVHDKEKLYPEEKRRIGAEAAKLIVPKDAILIASGTTVLALTNYIDPTMPLTVITSAMNVAMALLNYPNVEVIQLGGAVRHTSTSVVGEYASAMLDNFTCTKCFLGVDGIDPEYGLTTTHSMEACVNRRMIEVAQKTILLTDSSKFGCRGFSRICGIDQIDQIITDPGIPAKTAAALTEMGVKVTIV